MPGKSSATLKSHDWCKNSPNMKSFSRQPGSLSLSLSLSLSVCVCVCVCVSLLFGSHVSREDPHFEHTIIPPPHIHIVFHRSGDNKSTIDSTDLCKIGGSICQFLSGWMVRLPHSCFLLFFYVQKWLWARWTVHILLETVLFPDMYACRSAFLSELERWEV